MLAASAPLLVWSLLRGGVVEAVGAAAGEGTEIIGEEAAGVVRGLWDRLRVTRTIEAADDDDHALDAWRSLPARSAPLDNPGKGGINVEYLRKGTQCRRWNGRGG